jgi:hypothetical protein
MRTKELIEQSLNKANQTKISVEGRLSISFTNYLLTATNNENFSYKRY